MSIAGTYVVGRMFLEPLSILIKYKTSETPKIDNILIYQKKYDKLKCYRFLEFHLFWTYVTHVKMYNL